MKKYYGLLLLQPLLAISLALSENLVDFIWLSNFATLFCLHLSFASSIFRGLIIYVSLTICIFSSYVLDLIHLVYSLLLFNMHFLILIFFNIWGYMKSSNFSLIAMIGALTTYLLAINIIQLFVAGPCNEKFFSTVYELNSVFLFSLEIWLWYLIKNANI